ncbi:hypothetical protein [Nocardia sp. NPDC058705]|uniref:hypothetical protein n=1 Tax=Nocardia sp. NPDC058705 TaxID=3346609 RepID=UPI0036AA3AB1
MTPQRQIDWASFDVNVNISAPVVGHYNDPGLMQWTGTATYTVSSVDDIPADDAPLGLSVVHTDERGEPEKRWTVLRMHGLLVDPYIVESGIVDLLDGLSQDYSHFALLFGGDNRFHPDLDEIIEGVNSAAVLIDRVYMAETWRGRGGVGRLLISRILRLFAESAGVVATHPFPIELLKERDDQTGLTEHPRFEEELAKVRRTWESLGFERYTPQCWVLDPAMRTHMDSVARLEKTLFVDT